MKNHVKFIGLSPGYPPWGREPLFRVEDVSFGAIHFISQSQMAVLKIEIPPEEKAAVDRALLDWDNRGICDDNLLLTRR